MYYIESIRTALELLIVENNAYVIGEDVEDPYGGAFKVTKGLSTVYPDNVLNMPMCEQGMMGLACGMSLMGERVILEIMFGDFVTLICDQMINHAAKFHDLYNMDLNLVVRTPSGGYRGYGATHSQSLERLFFCIPGMQVVAPNILTDPGKLLEVSLNSGTPTLFVENKADYSKEMFSEESDFFSLEIFGNSYPIAKLEVGGEKPDISIITYGGMVSYAMQAARELFYEEELAIEIVVLSNLSELYGIRGYINTKKILVVEEGVCDFGWGSQVTCELIGISNVIVERLGAKKSSIPCSKDVEEDCLVTKQKIIDVIMKRL